MAWAAAAACSSMQQHAAACSSSSSSMQQHAGCSSMQQHFRQGSSMQQQQQHANSMHHQQQQLYSRRRAASLQTLAEIAAPWRGSSGTAAVAGAARDHAAVYTSNQNTALTSSSKANTFQALCYTEHLLAFKPITSVKLFKCVYRNFKAICTIKLACWESLDRKTNVFLSNTISWAKIFVRTCIAACNSMQEGSCSSSIQEGQHHHQQVQLSISSSWRGSSGTAAGAGAARPCISVYQ